MLYWSVSHGNDLKLLKFSVFEVFSYYPCLYFILPNFAILYLGQKYWGMSCLDVDGVI
jgi:hypothetical protein